MINAEKISAIQKKIEDKTIEQVSNGQQNQPLQSISDDYKACGQFFLKNRMQRGLHGTASALKVLGLSTNNDSKSPIPQIIKYITDHSSVEEQLLAQNKPEHKITQSENNVIKISECLYSLSYVQSGVGTKDNLVNFLIEKLRNSRIEGKGWGYFLNSNESIELLPTTFAALAVFSNQFTDFSSTYVFLLEQIDEKLKKGNFDLTTYAILVFALYVLTFFYHPISNNKEEEKKLRSLYKLIWKSNYRIFNDDIEQNVEYWNEGEHFYIRIPWQLYLLALSSKFSAWNFSSVDAQKRLNSIYENCVNRDGFLYTYSGPYQSVRTHAIIYEVLNKIRENLKSGFWYTIFNWVDQLRELLSSKIFKFITSILSILLSCYIVYKWITNCNISDLGPELLGAVLIWLILLSKEKK